jgi:hypothetical protein
MRGELRLSYWCEAHNFGQLAGGTEAFYGGIYGSGEAGGAGGHRNDIRLVGQWGREDR